MSRGLALVGLLLTIVGPSVVFAQTRDYHYGDINTDISVNPDSTISVSEAQTYFFDGEYHLG